ncbi:MAG: DUF1598 domain-containing protein [Pirellulaceae bacterium]
MFPFRCMLRRGATSLSVGMFCFALLAAGVWRTCAAQPADQAQAHLQAGEFGPALAAAQAIGDPAQRDAPLGDIAAAQAAAGAGQGSLGTAASISSDLARKTALDRIAAEGGFYGGGGGGVTADFTSLIDLMTTTVSPTSWDALGGPGSVKEFVGGVYVDPTGLLKKFAPGTDRSLALARRDAGVAHSTGNARRASSLRKVSLTRLEREVQLLHAQGRGPNETMLALAGLQRIKYVFFYPETGDIVLAGPAGDWRPDLEGRLVDVEKGRPVLQLDDLVVVLRSAFSDDPVFGCSITPTREGLAAAQAVNDKYSGQPLRAGQRGKWLKDLRGAVGEQTIDVFGIDPRTRTARVLVEADYRMKLVGMGLEEGSVGVTSYLDSIEVAKGEGPPSMSVLRWWFTLNYDALQATPERDAFELRGQGVRVKSENEHLTDRGERVHTGKSDELTARFAESFTKHFEHLAAKYPVYADLRNIFDLALVAAVVRSHDLAGQGDWHLTHFGPGGDYEVPLGVAPAKVDSVINHRVIGGRHVVAGVSGGVRVDPRTVAAAQAVKTDEYGLVSADRRGSTPQALPRRAWWWD